MKKIFLSIFAASALPIILLSSCSQTNEDSPVRLETTVFKTNNKNAFNNIFNLLNNQKGDDTFIAQTTEQINNTISEEILKNKLIQEKLRIYFFVSIFNSLNTVVDIVDNNVTTINAIGEREIGVNAIKSLITDSIIQAEKENLNKYAILEKELNKITDMKIEVSLKKVNEMQLQWVWKTSFKLAEDSALRKILKIQNDDGVNPYVDNSIFYKREISEEEMANAKEIAAGDNAKYKELITQAKYQSSKWYWDEKAQILTTIEKESNINPYSTDGTSGGFTDKDIKRTKFAIDFVQNKSNISLYKPMFLFQTNSEINDSYINSEWIDYLKYKKYKSDGSIEADVEKTKDILIDLKTNYLEYDKKV